jgi:hypothetical protein
MRRAAMLVARVAPFRHDAFPAFAAGERPGLGIGDPFDQAERWR